MDDELDYDNFQFIKEEILILFGFKNIFSLLSEVNIEEVMSGYYVGYLYDLKINDYGMYVIVEDVGKFFWVMVDGLVFEEGEQEIYVFIYEFEYGGWVFGY